MQGKSIAVPKATCSFTVTIKGLRKLYAFYFSLIKFWEEKPIKFAIPGDLKIRGSTVRVWDIWGGRIHHSLWPWIPGNSLGFSLDKKVKARSSLAMAALQSVWEVKSRLLWVQDIGDSGGFWSSSKSMGHFSRPLKKIVLGPLQLHLFCIFTR